mmetsp:Transcript_78454/g.242129  ORF Transcript_78454/g.242129 Transcript_78454/m.242129 type:complete len:239 (-) Transcript_78454:241-957(-)
MASAAGLPPEANVDSMLRRRPEACRTPGASEGSSARWSCDSSSATASQAAAASAAGAAPGTVAVAFPAAGPAAAPRRAAGSQPTAAAAAARPSCKPRPSRAVPSQQVAQRLPLSMFTRDIHPAGSCKRALSRCPSQTMLRTCTVSPTPSCLTMVSCDGCSEDVTAAGATMQYRPGRSARASRGSARPAAGLAAVARWSSPRANSELRAAARAANPRSQAWARATPRVRGETSSSSASS